MSWVRKSLLGMGAVGLFGYGGAIGWLKANETDLVFHPERYGGRVQVPLADSLNLRVAPVEIPVADSGRLAAWLVRSARSNGVWVLACHGNAGNITLLKRQRFYRDVVDRGFNLLAFDYRGFGGSSDVPLSESVLYQDATAAYRYLTDVVGVPPGLIVIYGHSLGGGVATELAATEPAAGLIVEGTFTSVPAVGQERYWFMPVTTLATNRFDNLSKIGTLGMPLLVLHARGDQTIPFAHGQRLFAAAREPKTFVDLAGDHDSAWEQDRERYMAAFATFVEQVTNQQSESP